MASFQLQIYDTYVWPRLSKTKAYCTRIGG